CTPRSCARAMMQTRAPSRRARSTEARASRVDRTRPLICRASSVLRSAAMKAKDRRAIAPGPFFADQIRPGDPYELSHGHAIFTPPGGQRHGRAQVHGGQTLETDPKVLSAAIDLGVSP